MTTEPSDLLPPTVDIVIAHLSRGSVPLNEIADFIKSVHSALADLGQAPQMEKPKQEPAVSIRSSVKHDYIVCLEDGVKLKMLKRYLRTQYDMSPEDYRAKWDLPRDYPMVAPAYKQRRRHLALEGGLGRKTAPDNAEPESERPNPTRLRTGKRKADLGDDPVVTGSLNTEDHDG